MEKVTDQSLERWISVLLRVGVSLSAIVVLVGGALYLARHGHEIVAYENFQPERSADRRVAEIVQEVAALRSRAIIQLGLLMLIATPIARVAFSLIGFLFERDRTYVVITLIVLSVLLFSLFSGQAHA